MYYTYLHLLLLGVYNLNSIPSSEIALKENKIN